MIEYKSTMIKNIQHLLLLATIVVAFVGCNSKDFTIVGQLNGGANKTIYIEELTPNGPLFIDSIRLDKNGNFKFSYEMPYQSFYNLHTSPTFYVMLLPENGEKIEIRGDYDRLETSYEVRGSAGSILLWQLQAYGNDGNERLKEVVAKDQENQRLYGVESADYRKAKELTDSLYFDIYTDQSSYVKQFIEEHRGSLATMIALYKPLGRDHALIDINRDPSLLYYYDEVLEGLEESLPDNPHTLHFKNSVAHLHHRYEVYQQRQQMENQAVITMGE